MSEKNSPVELKILESFKRASLFVPAYKEIIKKAKVDVNKIRTIKDFIEKVPLLKKSEIFNTYTPKELSLPGSLDSMASAIVTSGTSGKFAYSIISRKELENQKTFIDASLEMFFNASKLKTYIINSLPMGVSFSSSYPTIQTSVRSDIVKHIIKNFINYSDQIIIIADPNFAKKLIEEYKNIKQISSKLKFVIGGDYSSVSYFEYLKKILDTKEKNSINSTFGITEIGLNIGFTDDCLIKLRKELQNNPILCKAILGTKFIAVPSLFFYNPLRTFIEKIKKHNLFSDLAFTTLDSPDMPFIRYATGDFGNILDAKKINETLKENNREDLFLPIDLPVLALIGRSNNALEIKNKRISAEDIKQILFKKNKIAKSITGNFRLSKSRNSINLEIQLSKGIKPEKLLLSAINKVIKEQDKDILIKVYTYEKFPYNMVLDYESKWQYTKK